MDHLKICLFVPDMWSVCLMLKQSIKYLVSLILFIVKLAQCALQFFLLLVYGSQGSQFLPKEQELSLYIALLLLLLP